MPRKRWRARVTTYEPVTNPKDRNAVEDIHLVRHALVDFDELEVLSGEAREQLAADLVDAIRFARTGIKAGKRGLSDKAATTQIFISDVRRALERASLPARRWRKQYDNGRGESLFFRLAREVAEVSGLALPKDLKLAGKQAAQHQYGNISPAMKAAQEAELADRRQRINDLTCRLRSAARK